MKLALAALLALVGCTGTSTRCRPGEIFVDRGGDKFECAADTSPQAGEVRQHTLGGPTTVDRLPGAPGGTPPDGISP